MIDIQKAKIAFKEYVSNFDATREIVNLKIVHTYGVVDSSVELSKRLGLSEEDSKLAELIALLHDIGRFEQSKSIEKIFDKADCYSFDHAEYGVKILFEDNMIRKFVDSNEYDEIIRKAIKNHNKLVIEDEENMTPQELLHAKLIRDNDKIDNFRVKLTESFTALLGTDDLNVIENDTISEKIYNDFMNDKLIVTSETKTILDRWVGYIAFVYDLNYKESIEILQDKDMINKIFDRINYKNVETVQKMEKMRKEVSRYVKNVT